MVEANASNAKRSTGPRTERGRRAARLNAVKFGFFSEEVVIPTCDGDRGLAKYRSLITYLREELQPKGVLETWLVEKIAESLWRLRRATRAERGSSLVNVWNAPAVPTEGSTQRNVLAILTFGQHMVAVLSSATEEIRRTGTLSAATYAIVGPLVKDQQQTAVKPSETNEANQPPESKEAKESKPTIDDDFIRLLEKKKSSLESEVLRLNTRVRDESENLMAKSSLPPADDMNKILRYENRMRKQLDWALRKLTECQQRRKKFC